MILRKATLIFWLVFFGFALLTFSDIKVFEAWPQVTDLWNSGASLAELVDHFHFERYLAAYIGLYMGDLLSPFGFSIYISIIAAINTILFRKTYRSFVGRSPHLLVYLVFIAAHFAMNGRGPLGWCGWLLCLKLYADVKDGRDGTGVFTTNGSVKLFCLLLLASVSSGVFIVVFSAVIILVIRQLRRRPAKGKMRKSQIVSVGLSLCLIGYVGYRAVVYVNDAILKILLYFGSYTDVILHGLGVLFDRIPPNVMIVYGFALAVGFVLLWTYVRGRIDSSIWTLLCISAVGGAFGFTTLTLVIPIVLIIAGTLLKPSQRTAAPPDGLERSAI